MTYTPTLTAGLNCQTINAPQDWKVIQINDIVTVTGSVQIQAVHPKDSTHTGMVTFSVDVPVTGVNGAYNITGHGCSLERDLLFITDSGYPEFQVICTQSSMTTFNFEFSYQV